jgi:hypothetical protein
MSQRSKRSSSLAKHRTEPTSSRIFISRRLWKSTRGYRHSRTFHDCRYGDLRTPKHYVRSGSGISLSSMLFAKLLSSTMTCLMMKELYDSIERDGVGDTTYLTPSSLSMNRRMMRYHNEFKTVNLAKTPTACCSRQDDY